MGGRDKLCEDINGTPLLRHITTQAKATGAPVFVTLPALDHPRSQLLAHGTTPIAVPDAANGMSASLRAGVAALPAAIRAVMITPADLPELETADFETLLDAAKTQPGALLQAQDDAGTGGHPVIFPRAVFGALQTVTKDRGARDILRANRDHVVPVPLPGTRATRDLDTPEDWATWRAARSPG